MFSAALRFLPLIPLLAASRMRAEGVDAALEDPSVYFRIVKGIEQSSIDDLKPTIAGEFSYHIKSVTYLGNVAHLEKRYYVADVFFIRSSPKNSSTPPARGQHFLLLLDQEGKVVSCGRHDEAPDLALDGDVLKSGDKELLDFSRADPVIRYNGWGLPGGEFLPYPFEDRISDQDWESGAFREKREDHPPVKK